MKIHKNRRINSFMQQIWILKSALNWAITSAEQAAFARVWEILCTEIHHEFWCISVHRVFLQQVSWALLWFKALLPFPDSSATQNTPILCSKEDVTSCSVQRTTETGIWGSFYVFNRAKPSSYSLPCYFWHQGWGATQAAWAFHQPNLNLLPHLMKISGPCITCSFLLEIMCK